MKFPGEAHISFGCDAVKKILDGNMQEQEVVRAEFLDFAIKFW